MFVYMKNHMCLNRHVWLHWQICLIRLENNDSYNFLKGTFLELLIIRRLADSLVTDIASHFFLQDKSVR